eukprot:Gb_19994 [translate_table: standard]
MVEVELSLFMELIQDWGSNPYAVSRACRNDITGKLPPNYAKRNLERDMSNGKGRSTKAGMGILAWHGLKILQIPFPLRNDKAMPTLYLSIPQQMHGWGPTSDQQQQNS